MSIRSLAARPLVPFRYAILVSSFVMLAMALFWLIRPTPEIRVAAIGPAGGVLTSSLPPRTPLVVYTDVKSSSEVECRNLDDEFKGGFWVGYGDVIVVDGRTWVGAGSEIKLGPAESVRCQGQGVSEIMLGQRSGHEKRLLVGGATVIGLVGLFFGRMGVRFAKDPALNPSA